MCTCIYACMPVFMYGSMYLCMYTCMYACTHVCRNVYACKHACMHMYVYQDISQKVYSIFTTLGSFSELLVHSGVERHVSRRSHEMPTACCSRHAMPTNFAFLVIPFKQISMHYHRLLKYPDCQLQTMVKLAEAES